MKTTYRHVQALLQPLARRSRERIRALAAPAGMAAYVFATLMTASSAVRADDLDIYTKATAIAGGSPALALVLDTSAQMKNDMIQNPAQPATTLLHQRSYTMGDALRAVITSAPAKTNISLTNYANNGTYDKGQIMQEMVTVGNVAGTVGSSTSNCPGVLNSATSCTVTIPITQGGDDVSQVLSGGTLRTSDPTISMPYQVSNWTWPLPAGKLSGSWNSTGGAGLAASCITCTASNIIDPTKWQNPWSYNNNYYYYWQTSSTNLTQTFTLDANPSGSNDTVLFVVDMWPNSGGSPQLLAYNDNRSSTPTCNAGDSLQTSGKNAGMCAKAGKPTTYYTPTQTINYNSTVTVTLPAANHWYVIVATTFSAGKSGAFYLNMNDQTLGGWYDPYASTWQEQNAGFYFRNIQIPQGANISNAKLVFTDVSNTAVLPSVIVGDDNRANPPDFNTQDLNSRSYNWSSARTFDILTTPGLAYLAATGRVSDAVDNSGWCPGQAIALAVQDATPNSGVYNYLISQSFEGNAGQAAKLVITYDPTSGNPAACSTQKVTMTINSMSDDTNQFADGTMDVATQYMPASATDATLFEDRAKLWISSNTKVGLRFPLAPLPPGVTIKSAKLRLTALGTTSAQSMTVSGILNPAGNAQAFLGDLNYLDSLTLTSGVTWTPTSWVNGTQYDSPDLTSLVQAQVNQAGWVNESALGFVIKGSAASLMKACAWEYKPSGNFLPNVAGVLTPADFGSCAAQLIMTVDYGGNPVQTTYRTTLVNDLTYPKLPMTGNQPMGAAYMKTAEYLAGYFSAMKSDGVVDGTTCDTASPVTPALATGTCAPNTVVLIGDNNEAAAYDKTGYPNELTTFVTKVAPGASTSCTISGSGSNMSGKTCTTTLASMLFNGFTQVGATSTSIAKTFTINFGPTAGGAGGGGTTTGGGTMRGIATAGGGIFQQAGGSADLVKELLAIIAAISDQGATVAAPGVSVNALNRFEHLDQLYYSLFKPSTKIDWKGNLKRYQLLNNTVSGVDNNLAVSGTISGSFFLDTAWSWWSQTVDGAVVTDGGAAMKTQASARQIYTYLGSNSSVSATTLTDPVQLTNTNIDEFTLGIDRLSYYLVPGGALANQTMIDARRNDVINWLRATPLTDPTTLWAASIHGSPRIVAYNNTTTPTISVFYGDNRGLIHAIDAGQLTDPSATVNEANTGGTELFAFVPQDLLRNAALLNDNTQDVLVGGYVYGMDGNITLYKQDYNGDGNLDSVLLYTGERRGGKNYYALDVTNARADVPAASRVPKLQFVVQGGSGSYTEMGQSWSSMSPNKVLWAGGQREVLFFTGGYDAAMHDNNMSFQNVNQLGRMVYMIDAITGQLLWRSGDLDPTKFPAVTSMKYSMTATPRLIDRNGDGNADGMYVVDLAGQVFRFDFNSAATGSTDFIKNAVLVAKLGATAPGANATSDNRRFYDSPSVAYASNSSGGLDVLLAVSSGYREVPTSSTTKEAFFFFRDVNAFNPTPQVNPTLTMANLQDITNMASTTNTTGWYFYFNQSIAEKGIGSPVIFNGSILFSSFVLSPSTNVCIPDIGKTYLYLVDFTGLGLTTTVPGGTTQSRWQDIGLPGLGDTPQVLFRGSVLDVAVGVKVQDATTLCALGVTCPFNASIFGSMRRSRWYVVDQE